MPTYRVRVVKPTTLYADLYIEAGDEDEAEEIAQIEALSSRPEWELSSDCEAPWVDSEDIEEIE